MKAFSIITILIFAVLTNELKANDIYQLDLAKKIEADLEHEVPFAESSPWSNWYKRPLVFALKALSDINKHIRLNNLFDTNENMQGNIQCGRKDLEVRRASGACNNFEQPLMGSKGTRFGRNIPLDKIQSRLSIDLPDPRRISRSLFTRKKIIPTKKSNLLSAAFLQFVLHDWFFHKTDVADLEFSSLQVDDPIYLEHGQATIAFPKLISDGLLSTEGNNIHTYRNHTSHWLDASQLYGSTEEEVRSLRTLTGDGMLRLENDSLPRENGKEVTGDTRNWWLGLSIMHTLFAKEHNAIASMLKNKYPEMSGDLIFEKARLINSAITAKIFALELIYSRFENKKAAKAAQSTWYGLINSFFSPADRTKGKISPPWEKLIKPNLVTTGALGGPNDLEGTPFFMTEEWAHLYRYHSLIPDDFRVFGEKHSIEESLGDNVTHLIDKYGHEALIAGFGNSLSGTTSLHNTPKFLQQLKVPVLGYIDVIATDIYRERELGIPPYNEFRRLVGLEPIKSFKDLTSDPETIATLESLYGGDVEKMDLTVGANAESGGFRAPGFELSETHFVLLSVLATRRILADRFYTSNFNEETYTPEGIEWIENATFKDIILRHYPGLENQMTDRKNALIRWDY